MNKETINTAEGSLTNTAEGSLTNTAEGSLTNTAEGSLSAAEGSLGLDALFSSARQTQPNLMDDNFTKLLMNSLPKVNLFARKENAKKGLSFDLIGAMLGLIMAYFFIDGSTLLSSVFGGITDSFVISPLMIIMAIGSVALSSFLAWWVVEDNQL